MRAAEAPQTGMTDLHCHLLPGLDDGAGTAAVSAAMALAAVQSGVCHIVCTPHCTCGDPALAARSVQIRRSVEMLRADLKQKRLPLRVSAGMELLCGDGLSAALAAGSVLPLAESRCLLIEFPFETRLSRIERAAEEVRRFGYIPLLAHPERYPAVWHEPACLGEWFAGGTLIQLDQDSVTGAFGRRCARTAQWALDHGFVHAVASDAHGSRTRAIALRAVWQLLARRYAPEYAELLLCRNPRRIAAGRPVVGNPRE